MINIGKYIEMAINWLTENFAGLFDVINHIVGGFIDGFQGILWRLSCRRRSSPCCSVSRWESGPGETIRRLR